MNIHMIKYYATVIYNQIIFNDIIKCSWHNVNNYDIKDMYINMKIYKNVGVGQWVIMHIKTKTEGIAENLNTKWY